MASWLRNGGLAQVPDAERSEGGDVLAQLMAYERCDFHEPERSLPPRSCLLCHARVLRRALRDVDAALLRGSMRSRDRRRWLRRSVATIVILGALAGLVLATRPPPRPARWRGAYYAAGSGEIIRRDVDVDFDWRKGAPMEELPRNHFSVRWDTCLLLDEDAEARFVLTSDDGSILYVDDIDVVRNLGNHRRQSRAGAAVLDAGVHHIRVDYYASRGPASIRLRASFGDERPVAIPAHMLRYPGDEIDPAAPCSNVKK